MIHYCGLPIALTAPHCKIPELSISHVLHLKQRVGNGAACLWSTGSCQREASDSLFLPLPLALPQSVPMLCNIQTWLNSLLFFFSFFCSYCLLLLLILQLPTVFSLQFTSFSPSCISFLHILSLFSSPWKIRPPSSPSWSATPMLMGLGLWLNHLSLVRSSKFDF